MKGLKLIFVSVALFMGATAFAQTPTGKSGIGSTIGNMLQGIFTKSDIEVSDLIGEYESTGPAVAFKSDNFLKKAGGVAGATALETKLKPYYEQYGLIGMPFMVDKDGNFTLKVKRISIKGVLEKNDGDGTFAFNIMVAGMRLGRFTAYIEKSGKDLNLMFDATKLKELLTTIGNLTGTGMTKTLAKILESYDGACIGFDMKYTGGSEANGTINPADSTPSKSTGLDGLLDLLKRRS